MTEKVLPRHFCTECLESVQQIELAERRSDEDCRVLAASIKHLSILRNTDKREDKTKNKTVTVSNKDIT